MKPEPYPLFLERNLSRRLWGDKALESWLGLEPAGEGDPWGESWQVWSDNRILNGPLAGRTLQDAADLWAERLLGTAASARPGTQVPLLAKFIAAAQDLSLQVHPDDDYVLEHHPDSGHSGKAEAWLILSAKPDASVYWGFRQTVTQQQVRQSAQAGTLDELLNRVSVKPGDVIYNPPGTVHAIGAGIILFEIQQSSDLTFRLYDYGRLDSQGLLRELHLDEGLAVASLTGGENAHVRRRQLRTGEHELVASPHFVMTEIQPKTAVSLKTDAVSLTLLTAIGGTVTLASEAEQLELPAGTSLVLPAVEREFSLSGSGRLLRCFLPQPT